ncbi:MAG: nucleotidyltransferase domain-containing protein [Acidobacteria bacterium]|nr:MAG: nucleotidyltransferase domain-containing protein [Acidobacteriota bacterium]REK02311.1 MAG: nucleotidyltransferase domain-containing protein [Acidobacteriota bacterium]REK13886.1 MAG: nucleotidyltransferase domain-containing protein [Acidobacteriota bacterium]REK41880.1 MAG: nucleotidyltransferase domain-containing protein [Acidobacteriota bacterium]
MQHYFEDFIEDLVQTHGENLKSVVLYGSAATGEFVPFESDYNLLVALEKISPEDLRNAHSAIREWVKLGHPVPMYFTVSELLDAGDVFPIEFHFMERGRKVLFGEDVLSHVEISDTNLRHQLEYELRSHLLRLRRIYIEVSTSGERLADLMGKSISNFASDFRAIFLLRGIEPPLKKRDILRETAKHAGIEGASFEKVLAIRENEAKEKMEVTEANELFADYLKDIESVINAVDVLE